MAIGVGLVAVGLVGVGVKLIATHPAETLVGRPVRLAIGVLAIASGGFLVWLTAFLLATPLI